MQAEQQKTKLLHPAAREMGLAKDVCCAYLRWHPQERPSSVGYRLTEDNSTRSGKKGEGCCFLPPRTQTDAASTYRDERLHCAQKPPTSHRFMELHMSHAYSRAPA